MRTDLLLRTLELAQKRRGFCAPNPAVGALVLKEGEVISEGFHLGAGQPHAEVEALKNLSEANCKGATLYVSLEPCCHFGRTPPCTELIIKKGIRSVVYGHQDPNPVVAGKGAAVLRQAGVDVVQLPMDEVGSFYQSYDYWTHTKKPFTTAKLAMSLDGKIAGPDGKPIALTGEKCREFTHQRRLQSDALLTTAKTVYADDPQLNVRLGDTPIAKPLVLIDRLGRTPPDAKIFQTAKSVTLYVGEDVPSIRLERLRDAGAEVIALQTIEGRLPLDEILSQLGQRGIHDLWVEGGAALFSAFLHNGLAQRAYLYIAPCLVGAGVGAFDSSWPQTLAKGRITWIAQGRDVVAEVVW